MKLINGLDSNGIHRLLVRMGHEIVERNEDATNLALMGIQTRGAFIARRLQSIIEEITGSSVPMGVLDITLYRDDFAEVGGGHPQVRVTEIPFDVQGKNIILVDDVLFTGRTIRAALDAIIDYGRPVVIQLAVLIDRGHREFPIKADYAGKNVPTSKDQEIKVLMKEIDGEDGVSIVNKNDAN